MYSKNWSTNYDSDKENYNMNVSFWNSGPATKSTGFGFNQTPYKQHTTDSSYFADQKRMNDSNVKHSNFEVGFAVTYVEFENLPVLDQNVDLLNVFQEIKAGFESPQWTSHFNAINNLRALNKSYPREVNSLFKAFGVFILNSVNSAKPCINKNIIGFIYEVLIQSKESSIDISIVLKLIDLLIRKLNTTNNLLKSLTENCMTALLQNLLCDQSIVAVCELAVDRNRTISKIAFHFVGEIISILKERISELQPETLQVLFVTVGTNLESESANNKTLAKNMCLYFHHLMKENYENYIMFLYNNGHLSSQCVENFAKVIQFKGDRLSVADQIGRKSKAPLGDKKSEFWLLVKAIDYSECLILNWP